MRATEMHDLLKDCYTLLASKPVYHAGKGAFSCIQYCIYCGYSNKYPHDETCLFARLERATSGEVEAKL